MSGTAYFYIENGVVYAETTNGLQLTGVTLTFATPETNANGIPNPQQGTFDMDATIAAGGVPVYAGRKSRINSTKTK